MKKIASVFVLLLAILFVGVSVALANTIYFPIVHAPAPTPTPTQTPIPGPIVLPNGGFEQGHTVWNEYSNYGYDIIRYKDALNLPPHAGDWAAWLGGAIDDLDELDQTVTIPSDHPYLSFWLWIISSDTCNKDFAWIYVGDDRIDKHDLCYEHSNSEWVQKVYDLSAYSGQTVNLKISVDTDSTYVSSIYLDDFEFQTSLTP